MNIFVGSQNPVKVNAVVNAASESWSDVVVQGLDVPSGVSEQPRTDAQAKTGALNRAHAALEDGLVQIETSNPDRPDVLGIGLEGGVTEFEGELWNTVWAAVVDSDGNEFLANGARFRLPDSVAEQIEAGEEMGPLMARLAGEDNVRQKQGFIGIVTDRFVDRTEEYTAIVKLALGLWHGRHWERKLPKN